MLFWYRADVIRVIDGDTIELEVDQGFGTFRRDTFQLAGYDAPEPTGKTVDAGKKAKERLEKFLPKGASVWVRSFKPEKYGRWLCDVYLDGSAKVNVVDKLK
jgi:micrococcal nuclease